MSTLNIEVIGPGCRFCKKLNDLVREVISEKGIESEVSYITELKQVIRYIPFTPVLKINGKVAHRGKFLPSKEKIAALIAENAR